MKVLVNFQGETEWSALREAGHELVNSRDVAPSDMPTLWRELDGAITSMATAQLMAGATNLRTVISPVIGAERIDILAASQLGVIACNSPAPANFHGVAEATIGLIISLNKRLMAKQASIRGGAWALQGLRNHMLMGSTVGFIGFGRIPREVVKRLAGWELNFLAYDPYISADIAKEMGVQLVDLSTLMSQSDFVSLHVVATAETENMISTEQFRQMKPSAYLINTSRGQAVDEDAFCKAIDENWIAGGALDVFHQEPLGLESPLRDLDPERVILTPHSISHSIESRQGGIELATESMLRALRGEVPEYVLNPDVIPAWQARFGVRQD